MKSGKFFAALLLAAIALSAVPTRADSLISSTVSTQSAQASPAGVERVASVEGITEYRLKNGLKILLFPDQSKQTVTVNITYLVGSRHENYGETGMAHLLEHMLFKGTTTRSDIPGELKKRGGVYNASTWLDRTNYFEILDATDDNLKFALELEADRMINSLVAKKDLDSEMTVVRNEFEIGENDPLGILLERVQSTAYLWHNYGKSTIGARADIENVPIERLQAFYKLHYQPDNAVLLVAGKFDPARTLAVINDTFGIIPKPTRVPQKTYTVDPPQDGERSVTLRRTGDTQNVAAVYHIPAGSHPDAAAVNILARVLTDTPSGRLYKALVETKKASFAGGNASSQAEPGLLTFFAVLSRDQSLDAARDAILQTVEGVASNPITTEEVESAKAKSARDAELLMNDSGRVGLFLSEWIAMGDWRLLFLTRDRVKAVTVADVRRVANTYLIPSNRTLGLFIPTEKPVRAEVPATPDVAKLVENYKGGEAIAEGEVLDPTPANLDARTIRRDLKGGLKASFLPKKTRGKTVFVNLSLHFGTEKSLTGRATAGELAGAMLMRGTTKHTRQQLQDELAKLKARLFVFGGPTGATASIETTSENLSAVLKLAAEILREPAFPADEFERLKRERITGAEAGKSEPDTIAFLAYGRHMNPYPKDHVFYTATIEEEIQSVKDATLDDIKKFHADFHGAQFGEVGVVGDFDPKETAALLETLFGDWKNRTTYERIPTPYRDIAPLVQSFETPDKANASFTAGMLLKLRDSDPDYPALVVGDYILGGDTLSSRLGSRIRQKEGLTYGVGSILAGSVLDDRGRFQVFASYAPENKAKLEAAFREEIDRLLKDGVTAEEVEAAKAGLLQSFKVGRGSDRTLASALAGQRYYNRTYAWTAEYEAKIKAVTPEQINAAFRKHLDPAKLTIINAGDFAKKVTGH